ncbi:MAG: bifunctional 5,10-methylene-tetrahydrofolate dehydrogenase/5,10-methylene-tetrahydrofolate cyclohydrolase [Candidatus Eisenbacteria bacterium]|nr:bifunctional 5,10-methylene-tetrahydrofolate dehydrogenase/5,10-methylene-tetrahydrofolate cyclohydrolase [Candidatus Eisenbacteria bacterium]
MTTVLRGKPIASAIREEIAEGSAELAGDGAPPLLAVVLVGEDPASAIYTKSIERNAAKVGVATRVVGLDAGIGTGGVEEAIARLSRDEEVHGIILQQPLPETIDASVVERIAPEKDVDGATVRSLGLLLKGEECFAPCTAEAVVEMLVRGQIDIEGRHVVIVGRSAVVGKPLANLLLRKSRRGNATVTVCHSRTRDLAVHTSAADILVVAVGRPNAVTGGMMRPGAVVVDVGVNRIDDPGTEKGYRVVGDVNYEDALERASVVTPVPGGVGTLTTTLLLRNTLAAARRAGGADDPDGSGASG